MKRYKKFVIEAQTGISFKVSEGKSGEVIIKAYKTNDYGKKSRNYTKPPIPKGYKHICGDWNNGFVIERCSDGSQFVWVPVESLNSNGTLNGVKFDSKFGRRNYCDDEFSKAGFSEQLTDEFIRQANRIKKYGGFYISRYNISKNNITGKPQSVEGVKPWININFDDAKKVAATIENNEEVKSHLPFGAEYDSVLEWFIKSNARPRREIAKNSNNWGNYFNARNCPRKVLKTGSSKKYSTNNIYDFAGNVNEWTQEKEFGYFPVARGGHCFNSGCIYPVAYRHYNELMDKHDYTGFRAVLYIK